MRRAARPIRTFSAIEKSSSASAWSTCSVWVQTGSRPATMHKFAAADQSYFLHAVPAGALSKTLFPLGGMHKAEVREIAHAAGLPVFDKRDSTGICFIGERPFQDFLSRHLHTAPGPIETPEGRILGEHRGLALHTLGQRSGLKIGGRAGAAAAPWYVADKIVARNAL